MRLQVWASGAGFCHTQQVDHPCVVFPMSLQRESIFQQSVEAQKHASDLLEKKFQEALKKAKESPDTGKPIRDFDLD